MGKAKNPATSLYSGTKKGSYLLKVKNIKITKRRHALKGYASTYNDKILNFFNPEVQLKNTESAIRNKLKKMLYELRRFKLATTLVLVFKK